ncbi:peptide chain release factor 1 [uncultured Ilyobacter sp.]|uniref:peptide chain release factor 1 n=1 Tax=uncultured Ilyobacter sp. TaxID=544433 RepID=UPI0029C800F3|nr:peptide chain release factor 1 [uncultured Ilyobacter sp.]
MFGKLEEVVKKHEELTELLGSNDVIKDPKKLIEYNKALNEITPVVEKYKEYKRYSDDLEFTKESLKVEKDHEMKEMLLEEMRDIEEILPRIEQELRILLLPKDPNDDKNVIIEIRGGTGGDEAALFAANLYRMYCRYAERNKWKTEVMSKSEVGVGGLKEIVFSIQGQGAYSKLKFESGVHRVQRVPETESSGRIHTSTATVAVLPEVDDVEQVEIKPSELKIDTFRSSGAGGQHVNTTDSAVRITHLPSGVIVECQDERSQLKNREKAMKVLATKLYEMEIEKQRSEVESTRKLQVGTGARSEKIRTYNYPQGRITDHRIKLTIHKLEAFLDGDLTEMIDALITFDQADMLTNLAG